MPKSKRQRTKPLTQSQKKGSDLKQNVVAAVRDAVDNYSTVYAFSFENMRTNHFKEVRLEFRDSRFFLGKNKVMKVALGRSKEEEYADELCRLASDLSGNVGLLFTNKPREEVEQVFGTLVRQDYPRSGFVATDTVKVEEGELPQFIGSMVESLRALGLPVDLKKGKIVLTRDHVICKQGQTLTPEQAQLLKHFDRKMAEFRLRLVSVWSEGTYKRLDQEDEDM